MQHVCSTRVTKRSHQEKRCDVQRSLYAVLLSVYCRYKEHLESRLLLTPQPNPSQPQESMIATPAVSSLN